MLVGCSAAGFMWLTNNTGDIKAFVKRLMKKDIVDRQDIDLLLHTFYNELLKDNTISYIFTDVVKIDMEVHIPIIANFWESVLLHKNLYHDNPMRIHVDMNRKTPLLKHHFDTWVHHFISSVDKLFEGDLATMAKERAISIATVMQIKIASKAN